MSQYYIGKDNQRLGPYPLEQLISYGLTPDTLVWCTGMPGWQKAIDVPEVATLFAPKQPEQPQYQQPEQPQYQPQYQQPQYQQPQYQQPQYQQPQYQQPAYQQPYQQPNYGYNNLPPRPDNNMVWAILSTILCCLPLGIVAIIKSSQVNDLYNRGDYAGAEAAAKSAKSWALWGAGIALIGSIIYVLLIVFGIAAGASFQ